MGRMKGCIKMRALGSFHGMGCSRFRFECETPTQRDLYTGNLNLTLINKTKRLFTPKNSNTGSFTYEGQSIIYIHTARDGRAITGELIVSHNYRSPFLVHWRWWLCGCLSDTLTTLRAGFLTRWHVKKGEERRRKSTKLKMNPVWPHHPLAFKNASMKFIWIIFLF